MTVENYNLFNFTNAKILAIGDLILDTYWHGVTNRTSPEAPVPVAHLKVVEHRLAGIGNIAGQIQTLGGRVDLITDIGCADKDNKLGTELENLFLNNQLSFEHVVISENQLNQRVRIVSQAQQLLRIDSTTNNNKVQKEANEQINAKFLELYTDYNTIIFYDNGDGVINNRYLKYWLDLAHAKNIKTIYVPANKQILENFLINQYKVDYIISHIENSLECDSQTIDCSNLGVIYYDASGLTIFDKISNKINNKIKIESLSTEVENIIGIKETIAAIFTLAISSGQDILKAAELANAGLSYVIRQFGQYNVNIIELQLAYADYILDGKYNYINLKQEIDAARAKNKKIVFANGCFDVLHVGHVAYLDLAKQRGDKLFIAINSDCSIKRLKGDSRPVNCLADRLYLLKNLTCQDWVVPFFTDTPEDFLRWLKPDLLVKGGDYTQEQIVGSEIVYSYGGKTEIIQHPYNTISSSKILAQKDYV